MRVASIFGAMLASVGLPAKAQTQTVWRAATEYPATTISGEGLARFAATLAGATAGRVTMQPRYDAPDGLKSAAIPGAVQAGNIEVGESFAGALSGLDPLFQMSSLPFLATSLPQARALYDAARPAYAAAFAKHGQILLYSTPWPPSGLWTRDPTTTVAALRSLKIRTYDATSTLVLRAAGAVSIELSFGDTMQHLQDGSVNAVLSSGDGGAGRRLWEFLPNFTPIGYAMPLSFATVSRAAFDRLDPDLRDAVIDSARQTEAAQWEALETRTTRNEVVMLANGVKIRTPDADLATALAEAAQQINADWEAKAGPDIAAILATYRSR